MCVWASVITIVLFECNSALNIGITNVTIAAKL